MRSRWLLAALVALSWLPLSARGGPKATPGLEIYFVDTEGGAATLIVTPLKESVLIDCGNPGSRDAERIHRTAQKAGLKAIDHLVITHWHTDHYGGVARLSQLMPIHHYYDHGIPAKLDEDPRNFPLLIQAYKKATQGKSKTLKPGDEIALKQTEGGPALHLVCLCGSRDTIPDKEGAPTNPIAKEHKPQPEDKTDNARSLGFLLSFGNFRFLDLGDLTWNIEYKLVHPTDKIGLIDVYQSTHHGLEISNNPVLINTVQPRVAIVNNGARKGGHPSVIGTLRRLPEIQAIYQMHRNVTAAAQDNTDPEFIANMDEKCQGKGIQLFVSPDASVYEVMVGDSEKAKRYQTRKPAP
jgi:beta-lactamase superfamily II metal-dependent hydrolase